LRTRFTEDRLSRSGCDQYVLLGAGLDSFGLRRADLLRGPLRLFEVDQPESQSFKRARLAELGVKANDHYTFAPVDFQTQEFLPVLASHGLDLARPVFFSWLGVAVYLTLADIEATLAAIASCVDGSELVMTYCPIAEEVDAVTQGLRSGFGAVAAAAGEPNRTFLPAASAEELVRAQGLTVIEHPTPAQIVTEYFNDRQDGLRSLESERLLHARVVRP
jgi:methyltransferase (TIGR00027 family)